MKDPRDVIIRPVVSEKSYALLDAERLHVHGRTPTPSKPEIHDAVEAIFDVKVAQGEHAQPQGQAQAQPPHRSRSASRPTPSGPSSPSPRATRIELFEAIDRHGTSQAQAHQPRSPVPDRLRLLGDHQDDAREVAARPRSTNTGGRNNYGRKTARHRVAATSSSTASSTSSGPRTACRPRSPRSSTTRTATAASLLLHYHDGEKRYILAPKDVKVGDMLQSGQGSEIRPGNALPLRYIPVGTTVHNVELKPGGGGKMARSRRLERAARGQGGRLRHPAPARPPRCAACRSTAAPPSARSATPRPS